jgi:hypothetical protein
MTRQGSRRNDALSGGEEAQTTETHGMVAVGEMPALDLEFEALLSRASDFQKLDSGCKLRGEAR